MGNYDCCNFNEHPAINSPITADDSNPHHGSPGTNEISNRHSNLQSFSTGPQSLAIDRGLRWPKRTTLNVVFISTWTIRQERNPNSIGGGEITQKFTDTLKKYSKWWERKPNSTGGGEITQKLTDAVKKYSKWWEHHCTIKFTFDQQGEKHIRIGFGAEGGCWSQVGKNALEIPVDERTMNLAFNDNTSEIELQRTTLHQFGHVLGCIHEHQSPASPILWNEEAVHHDVSQGDNPWTDAMIQHNVLNINTNIPNNYIIRRFDPGSIMLSKFDAHWMLNPECVGHSAGTLENHKLSPSDIRTIKEMYPPDASNTGRFSTSSIPFPSPRLHQNPCSVPVALHVRSDLPPLVAVGLSSLHIVAGSNVRIRTSADNIARESYVLHIDTWANTNFDYAACNWFEAADGSRFQIGSFNTLQCRPWDAKDSPAETSANVEFKTEFDVIPTIVVWLNWIDTNKDHDTSVKAYATDITANGFKIHVDTWGDCVMSSAGASWIAYPTWAGSISGKITTIRDTENPRYERNGQIMFQAECMRKPTVLIAVSSIDFAHGNDVHFDVLVEDVEATGMTWRINSSLQSSCRGIDATYLAC